MAVCFVLINTSFHSAPGTFWPSALYTWMKQQKPLLADGYVAQGTKKEIAFINAKIRLLKSVDGLQEYLEELDG